MLLLTWRLEQHRCYRSLPANHEAQKLHLQVEFTLEFPDMRDIFVSYTQADKDWAEWIAWTLKKQGYSVHLQSWASLPGINWPIWMHDALNESPTVVVVLSNEFMRAIYTKPEFASAFVSDPTGRERKLIPVRVKECKPKGLLAAITYADLVGLPEREAEARLLEAIEPSRKPSEECPFPSGDSSPSTFFPVKIKDSSPPRVRDYFSESWPVTDPFLVGRENEIRELDAAWETSEINVISLVAWGGVGKTSLLNWWWVRRMQPANWRGAERVFAWSFYNQGAEEGQQASADQFVGEALRWFGDAAMAESSLSPWDKGLRLAELVRERRSLLLLDGLEPLQEPTDLTRRRGSIKDAAVRGLLLALANGNPGLCVVTTRLRVTDLAAFEDTSVRLVDLEQLTDEAGARYLEHLGVKGTEGELLQVADEFGGHPLALTLLGKYLAVAHGGDIKQRISVAPLVSVPPYSSHARRVMLRYEQWFRDQPEIDILCMMSLFDRPAEPDAINILREAPPIHGLTDRVSRLSPEEWLIALNNLRNVRLLSAQRGVTSGKSPLDCHPLVREHFSEKLRNEHPDAWHEAHSRLFDFFNAAPGGSSDALPETLRELEPLYRAVAHGCKARRFREALEVYVKKILMGSQYYSWKKYGNFGTELVTLSKFFERLWDVPTESLAPRDRGYVLNEAGFHLMALAQMREALNPALAALELFRAHHDYDNVAISGSNLSKLYLDLGELEASHVCASDCLSSVKDKCRPYPLVGLMVADATSLHHLGRHDEASRLFREAENIHQGLLPDYPYLYAFRGFRYCELLLDRGDTAGVRRRSSQTLSAVENQSLPTLPAYSLGLSHLSLGEAFLLDYRSDDERAYRQARHHIESAIELLRRASQQRHVACALLASAKLRVACGEFDSARQDLDQVLELTGGSEMRRLECDTHVEYCSMFLARAEASGRDVEYLSLAEKHLGLAEQMADEMRYRRRLPALSLLTARLNLCKGKTSVAREDLEKSKELAKEVGYYRLEGEAQQLVGRLEGRELTDPC